MMARFRYRTSTFNARKSVGYLIRRLNNLTIPHAQARFADQEITFTHWIALISLRDGISHTCSDIARHLGHDTGATTRLIDQLEVRGLIMRRRDEVDRRIVNLSLTDAGHAVATELMPRTVQFWNDMLAEFTTDEASTLIELLSRLLTRMEAEPMATMKNAAKQRVPKTK
ncbi:MAG: MarR family transcriptional regulator [Gammaproteobacteria bacterium]|mgnify:FL=1|jgi:DNA-binding MarR family transcriptional regulator|nr:MarR family transcriptional regulator [Gammaproteobacteria bacterium]MBP6226872.1 MarR family transcriptional regulator [Pseudomonadales bacterium]MBK6584491.1 MarR family transcriptional regulator [Gammaproteobacteria bacterium]MBK7520950.1 MarR family transcriptional regulator [Gammaproteobacteria bacterium]MBK8309125.1 MarR family transcriptional regulator [Gammaproteobacteria bacterium]